MQPEKEILSNLLEKYLQGKADKTEVELLHKWFWQLDVREQDAFKSFSDEEKVRLEMKRRIMEQIQPEATVRKINYFPTWLQAAAASVLLLIGVFFGYNYLTESLSAPIAIIEANGTSPKKVTLPDGTVVNLNLYSKLELDEDYNKEERKVKLTGEAFFDVKHDTLRPFIVTSNNISTRVLGTAFNVEAYEKEEQVRVALLRGKVRVQDKNELQSELAPGQVLVYNKAAKAGVVQPMATQQIAGWLKNKIIFNDVSLQDAIYRIQYLHQLTIQIDPALSLEGKRVTGEYENAEAVQALEAILFLHHMKLKRQGDILLIEKS